MPSRNARKRRITLDSLVDLEVQLQRDKEADPASLRKRDSEIGQQIDAGRLEAPELFLRWLDDVQERGGASTDSPGARTKHFVDILGVLLAVAGLLLGSAAVTSWLAYHTERPVNIIYFWATIIGLQLVLLLGWCIAVLPTTWLCRLPGMAAAQTLLRGIGRMPAAILTWISTRFSSDFRQAIDEVRGDVKRLDWIYGRLKLWILVRLTQVFAIAYNLGAIAAFVALSYGNDPSFGWRSTMLSDNGMHGITHAISLPWSQLWPAAVPTMDQVHHTRYSSLDDVFMGDSQNAREEDVASWASWWPFLLASLLVYGLLPRLGTCIIADVNLRRLLRSTKLDHHEFRRLAARLRRVPVTTQALGSDVAKDGTREVTASLGAMKPDQAGRALPVLKWAGVDLDTAQIEDILRRRIGASVARMDVVGDLNHENDQRALERLREDAPRTDVILIVEAWEPPVADYVDFIRDVRAILGEGRMINVLLYHRHGDGATVAPLAMDREVWRGRLAAVGDPWLAVEPLVDSASSADATGGNS